MKDNLFINESKREIKEPEPGAADNPFISESEEIQKTKKQLPWLEGLGVESLYRIPGLALQGAGGAIAGEPGDVASLFHGAGGLGAKGLGQESTSYEESTIGKILPKSEALLKGAALQPKNKIEDFVQNLAHDATKLFLPGKYLKAGRYAMTPLRSLAISAGSNTLGKGIEGYTGSKEKGDLARHGSMLLLSFLNPQTAENLVGQTYQTADRLLPQAASVSGTRFATTLNNLENRLLQGRHYDQLAPSERWVIDRINEYRPLIQNGQLNMRSLVAQKRSTNERAAELYNFGRRERGRARRLVGEIQGAATNEMQHYGRVNPQWWQNQRSADQAFGATQQSNFIQRAMAPLLKGKENSIIAHVFGSGIAGVVGGISKPAALGGAALYQGAKYAYRIANSPLLARHYGNVLAAAVTGNKENLTKALNEFEKALQKDDKKRKSNPSLDSESKEKEKSLMENQ